MKASIAADDARWPKDASEECRQFLIDLLSPEHERRMTATEAGLHPWLSAVATEKHAAAASRPVASPLVQCHA